VNCRALLVSFTYVFELQGSDTSDYEEWVPADALRDGSCLMGRKIKITRRKRAVQCFNGWDFDR